MRRRWIYRTPKPHDCQPPETWRVHEGSIWECRCGKQWQIRELYYGLYRGWHLGWKAVG